MSYTEPNDDDFDLHDMEDEVYLDDNEAAEELAVGEHGDEQFEMDEDVADGEQTGDQLEFNDDSIQGFFEHREPVFSVAFSPANPLVAVSGGGDDKSYLWSLETGDKIADLGVHSDSCSAVSFSSDGRYIASGGLDGKLHLFDFDGQSVSPVGTLEGPSEISWIQWHPRGNVVLAAGEDGTLWMWQVPSLTCMNVFTGHADSVTCGQWTPDGKHIVSGSADGSIIVWDPKTGAALQKWSQNDGRFHQAAVTALSVNKDNSVLVSGDQTGQTLLLQLSSSKILGSLQSHGDSVETIQFCNTLPYVATGGVDGKIHVWDIHANLLRFTCSHEDAVTRVRWSPASAHIVSSSVDGTLKVWDGRTGELVRTLHGHQNGILDFDIRADGSIALTGSDDGVALCFPIAAAH
ncbi:hypothetical protein HDV03_002998 [Kappamyces sp. JEL0829]|nr:hypothetical protein HDV03_002998 [Kappamyces sp. JEL0829]